MIPARCEGVRVIGVDEHVWRHTLRRQIRHRGRHSRTDRRGPPALGHGPGRSKQVSKPGWPPTLTRGANALRSSRWMDSPGSKGAAAEELPGARQSWTPSMSCTWHSSALDEYRRRIQQELHHRRRRATSPHTRPADVTPDPACSPHASSTRSSTCSPAITRRPRSHMGVCQSIWHIVPNKISAVRPMQEAEINTLTLHAYRGNLPSSSRWAGHSNAEPRHPGFADHPHTNGLAEAISRRLGTYADRTETSASTSQALSRNRRI